MTATEDLLSQIQEMFIQAEARQRAAENAQTAAMSERIDQAKGELVERADEDRRETCNYRRMATETMLELGERIGAVEQATRTNTHDIAAARRAVSDIRELNGKTREHVSSSDLDAEARHAAIIAVNAKKEQALLETQETVALLNMKIDAIAAPKTVGGEVVTLSKLDDDAKRRSRVSTVTAIAMAIISAAEIARAILPNIPARAPIPALQR